jgi:hypothetical protein
VKPVSLPLLALLLTISAHAAEPALVHLEVADVPAENGKMLNMVFDESARDPESSTVQVLRRSGGSVSSSMFILRGACAVARARGKQQFVSEQLAGDPGRFRLTFPDVAPARGKGFTLAQCEMLRF